MILNGGLQQIKDYLQKLRKKKNCSKELTGRIN